MNAFFTRVLTWYLLAGIPLLGVVSYASYWWDKRQAIREARRTPEARLLTIDLLGGWPGGWLAQRRFHHKTRKLSYRIRFSAAAAVHVLVTGGLIYLAWG